MPLEEKYDNHALDALKLLLPGLLQVKQSQFVKTYMECQKGAWNEMKPVIAPALIQLGASHAIAHKLIGIFEVDIWITSCVMLPAVMQWNLPVNKAREAQIMDVFRNTRVAEILKKEGSMS